LNVRPRDFMDFYFLFSFPPALSLTTLHRDHDGTPPQFEFFFIFHGTASLVFTLSPGQVLPPAVSLSSFVLSPLVSHLALLGSCDRFPMCSLARKYQAAPCSLLPPPLSPVLYLVFPPPPFPICATTLVTFIFFFSQRLVSNIRPLLLGANARRLSHSPFPTFANFFFPFWLSHEPSVRASILAPFRRLRLPSPLTFFSPWSFASHRVDFRTCASLVSFPLLCGVFRSFFQLIYRFLLADFHTLSMNACPPAIFASDPLLSVVII